VSESKPGQQDVTPAPSASPDASRSVLEGIGSAAWSEEDGVSYEVALEDINRVVGAYSGLIGDEENAASPDAGKIAAWRQAKLEWAARRRALSPGDAVAVQAVRREAADLLRELTER
jgi:predicted hotdog family 3-hydroxylacyl-ACP dehydratase